MMSFETLVVRIEGTVANVTLNRPDAKNAMNNQMVLDLMACFEGLKNQAEVRVIVLSGANRTFCAGGDLKEMSQADHSAADYFSAVLDQMLCAINEAPQVVVAKIEGAAMGGGFGLVCVADIAIASTEATMGLPEVRLGIVPAIISPYVIERIGVSRARELMLTGRRFDGLEALTYGVIHEAVVPEALESRVKVVIDEIKLCSPQALAACKQLIFTVKDQSTTATAPYRTALLGEMRRSADGQEGMKAFIEKRAAKWVQDS